MNNNISTAAIVSIVFTIKLLFRLKSKWVLLVRTRSNDLAIFLLTDMFHFSTCKSVNLNNEEKN